MTLTSIRHPSDDVDLALETDTVGGTDVDVFIMDTDWGDFSAGDLVLDANSNGDESFVHVMVISYGTTDVDAAFEDLTP